MSQSSESSGLLTAVRLIGLVLFVAGFVVFLTLGVAGGYALDAEALETLESSGAIDQAEVLEALRGLEGTTWRSAVAVGESVDEAIAGVVSQGGSVGDWQRTPFKTAVARSAARGPLPGHEGTFFWLTFGLSILGALLYFLPRFGQEEPGIQNDRIWFSSMKARGVLGIATGVFLIGFYVLLYFKPYLITAWIRLADPVAALFGTGPADRWFFYGFLYTVCVVVMGVRFALSYRHSRYQLVRTASVSFFQLGFAFLLPGVLAALNQPSVDLKNAWPLNYSFFADYNREALTSGGAFGWTVFVWGIALAILVVPAMAAFFGKRWYCSWVCGCGGLAETLGDPYRQLSDKSLSAWKIERWMVHAVLVFAVVMTGLVLADALPGVEESDVLGGNSWKVRNLYGFLIGSIFAGVVGTGFYPLMGNRVWCRFGCPLAAILGIVQRFQSRFRITSNGGQCISCGNCSTYCEMGIDVRWYAQRGQDIVRASCVGCGICSQVCPRGVLRLENGPTDSRVMEPRLVQIGTGRIDVG